MFDPTAVTPQVMIHALALALFTLSLGHGPIMTYGSYMQNNMDLSKVSLGVCLANFVASLLIALAIFPLVFSFGFEPQAGEGLIFKTLPYVFEQLPGSLLLGCLFFTLLLFTALTSSVAQMEVLVANLIDLRGWSRIQAVRASMACVFVLGLPTALGESTQPFIAWASVYGSSFLEVSNGWADWVMICAAFGTSVFVGWRLPSDICQKGLCAGTAWQWVYTPWIWCVRWLVPFGLLLIILHRAGLGG